MLLFPAVTIGSVLLWASASNLNHTFSVFGPVDYMRAGGKPVTVTSNFSAARAGGYILRLYNGGKNGQYGRSSSATISVNNTQVAGPGDFNQKVSYIEKSVALATQNSLAVILNGSPNSGITIEIVGVDNDAPTISATIDPSSNTNGWNNSNVQVSFSCSDATSGIATCSQPVTVSAEGANQIVTGTATDRAGNSATTSVRLNIDKTPPVVMTSISPGPNAAGWNNTNVTVSFNCSDNLSGIGVCPPLTQVTQEGANQVLNRTATDLAGNSAPVTAHINLDKTPPAITIVSPLDGSTSKQNAITISGNFSDSQSGVAALTCNGSPATVSGANFSCNLSLNEGSNTISLQAIDVAGNRGSASLSVMRDTTPPAIHISSPVNLANINAASTDVSGTVDDSTATVTVNGAAVPVINGTFTVANVPLQIGNNTITATATDPAGNSSSAIVNVNRQGMPNGPYISSLTPSGAHFGDLITIRGSGFGNDPNAVKVRFAYDYGSGVYTVDQPVFNVADDNLKVAIPLAVPEHTNQVSILINNTPTPSVAYDVGSLPVDPTPNQAGNEALSFLSDIDELITRFDTRLDSWFVETQTLSQTDADGLHEAMAKFHLANQQLRSQIQTMDAQSLHVLDTLVSTQFMTLAHDQLHQAITTLDGSPLGSRLCEGNALDGVLDQILKTLAIITDVVHEITVAVGVVCAIVIIADIFTLGALSPLAGTLCAGAISTVLDIIRTINDVLRAAVHTMQDIIAAAPVRPKIGTYSIQISQQGWSDKPDFVYVTPDDPVVNPVAIRAFNDFHNPQCDVDVQEGLFHYHGCKISFDITVFGVPISFTKIVPYTVASHLNVISNLSFQLTPDGREPFRTVFTNEGGDSRFAGNDVNGPASDRGTYDVIISSDCGAEHLGTIVEPFRLVGAPILTSITPQSAQLGSEITLCGDLLPPFAEYFGFVDFGDARANLRTVSLHPVCYGATIPDTALVTGNINLNINGAASNPQPFTVLPPTLTRVSPNPGFPGEQITLVGTGFAADPANNRVQANGVNVNTISQNGSQIVFETGNATSGPLQLTAMGTHVSNDLSFKVAAWSNPATLSNSNRDADEPALAVLTDGSAGVVWIDRNRAGGPVRLLFADARPGDASFRSPIAITSDLAGLASAPQKPAIAAGPDRRFHVIWVNTGGEIRMASFAFGAIPAGDQLVAAPPSGFVFKDPAVAVLGNNINVSVTEVPAGGDFNFVLAQTVSHDGGASFVPLTNFEGPGRLLGEISLATANASMWRAYTKSDSRPGYDTQRVIVTQHSTDGALWSAPTSPDNNFGPDYSITVLDERPSVTGDSRGAVVVWDSPQDLMDKFVWANAEPFNTEGRMLVPFVGYYNFPNTGATDPGGERPSVVIDSNGIISAAWLRRDAGTSPDGIGGVPHIHFNRSADRFATLQFSQDQTPTHAAGDATTIDNRPTLAVDADNNLHLIWLEGPAGNRIVRYMTTAPASYSDSIADDPPLVPLAPRELIAVTTENDPGDGINPDFNGTLVLDPNDPTERRWVAMNTTALQVALWDGVRGPSFKPNSASMMLMDNQHRSAYLPLTSDLGSELTPQLDVNSLAHQLFPSGSGFLPVIDRATWTPDGRIIAVRETEHVINGRLIDFFPRIAWSDPSDPRFLTHSVPDVSPDIYSEDNADASNTGQYFAYERRDKDPQSGAAIETLRVAQFDPYTELTSIGEGHYPSWSPRSNTVVFVQGLGSIDEYSVGAAGPTDRLDTAGAVQWPVYRNDGDDIAFQFHPFGAGSWTIHLTSGGSVPTPAGYDDTRPVWSPDGQSILFIRTETGTQSSQLMRWDIATGVVKQLTNLPSHVVLGGAERECRPHFGFGSFPCFPGRPVWVKVLQ